VTAGLRFVPEASTKAELLVRVGASPNLALRVHQFPMLIGLEVGEKRAEETSDVTRIRRTQLQRPEDADSKHFKHFIL
jgi:hypothetical protein